MSISCAVLMCHAPIVIPAIAGTRAADCRATTEAMRETARALVAHEPALIVLISPHAPRRARSIGITFDQTLSGDFARFGHAQVALELPGAPGAAELIALKARAEGIDTHALAGRALDHGSMVPLFFVHEAGYRGAVVVTSLPYPGTEIEAALGQALHEAARESVQHWAILASGDMSHRLTRDAPAGFAPRAREFDRGFARALRHGDLRSAIDADPELLDLAAEDVVQSTAVAAAAVQYRAQGTRVFAYEAPFGVGYLEALLFSQNVERALFDDSEHCTPPYALVEIALSAIDCALRREPYTAPALAPPWHDARAVFVTLRSPSGELRGCIGRTEPRFSTLSEEVADCAVSAATRDARMPSVCSAELPALNVEVSVLSEPERIDDLTQLDPQRYGVVVEQGPLRGVLLPEVEGVESGEQQLRITLRKAGITEHSPYHLSRFVTQKVRRKLTRGTHGTS
jgi:AmmeMemoRadiSam system protein A